MFVMQCQNIKSCSLREVISFPPLLLFFDFFPPPLWREKEEKYCAALFKKHLIFPFVFMHHLIFNQSCQMPEFEKTKIIDQRNHPKK